MAQYLARRVQLRQSHCYKTVDRFVNAEERGRAGSTVDPARQGAALSSTWFSSQDEDMAEALGEPKSQQERGARVSEIVGADAGGTSPAP
jgi:hypothetical protein